MSSTMTELDRNIARLMPWTKKRIAEYIIAPYNKKGFERVMTFSEPIGDKLETMSNKRLCDVVIIECLEARGGKEFRKSLVGKPRKEVKEFLWKKLMFQHYHKFPIEDLEFNRFKHFGKIFKVGDAIELYDAKQNSRHSPYGQRMKGQEFVFITSINYNKDIIGKSYKSSDLWDLHIKETYGNMEEFRRTMGVGGIQGAVMRSIRKEKEFLTKVALHIKEHGDFVVELNGERITSEPKSYHFTDASKIHFTNHFRTSL